jgi:exosortase
MGMQIGLRARSGTAAKEVAAAPATTRAAPALPVGYAPNAAEWLLIVLLCVGFAPALVSLSHIWSSVDYLSHGYLVPFVALWAATGKRALLPTLERRRDLRGLALLTLAFALYLGGVATTLPVLEGLAVVSGVAGGVLLLRGPAWLRALSFSIGYLLFMIPLPEPVLTPVIVELQLGVSSVGVWLLQLFDFAVFRNGNVIELPGDVTLFVAEACSGITSVVTLLPLGVFLGYFTERTLARRLVLVAAVVPLALLGNLIRVVGTVLAANEYGAEAATKGAVHESAGIFTYVLGCIALLLVGRAMRWISPPAARRTASETA